jgi:hypothetical protein
MAITIINSMRVKPDSLRGYLFLFMVTSSVCINGENAGWFPKERDADLASRGDFTTSRPDASFGEAAKVCVVM